MLETYGGDLKLLPSIWWILKWTIIPWFTDVMRLSMNIWNQLYVNVLRHWQEGYLQTTNWFGLVPMKNISCPLYTRNIRFNLNKVIGIECKLKESAWLILDNLFIKATKRKDVQFSIMIRQTVLHLIFFSHDSDLTSSKVCLSVSQLVR